MSYEAWGDDDGTGDYDHLIDAGWWSSEQADDVTERIKDLARECVFEGRTGGPRFRTQFRARLVMLQHAAYLLADSDRVVLDAKNSLGEVTVHDGLQHDE